MGHGQRPRGGWRLQLALEVNGAVRAQIKGIEYYLPATVLDNQELARLYPEWTAEQIEQKTGIRRRHIAAPDETSADMAVQAAKRLFARGKGDPSLVDFVILCTESPDYFLPPSACTIQDRLGIPKRAGALDYNLACSGFVYGLAVAKGLVETGSAKNVLLLTAETYSKFMHPQDKSVRTLFGDAAAATLVGVAAGDGDGPLIGPFVFGTDGSRGGDLIVKAGGMRVRGESKEAGPDAAFPPGYLHMDGPAIFSFTLREVPNAVRALLSQAECAPQDVDLYVFHQANAFMLEALRKQLAIPRERFVVDLTEKGNTVSSTIPIALLDAQARGQFQAPMHVMLVGFGVGLSWAAAMVHLCDAV